MAALVCGTWGYFYLQNLKKPTLKPFDVLPDSCAVLVEVKEPLHFIAELTQGNLMWEEFLKINNVQKFGAVLSLLDSLTNNEELREYLGREPFYIALYGKKREAVYAFNLSDVNEEERAIAFFENNFAAKKLSAGVYQCVLQVNGKTDFYIFTEAGLVVASVSKEFIESVSEKNTKQALASNTNLLASYKTAAKDKGTSIFLHEPFFYRNTWNRFLTMQSGTFFAGPNEKWIPVDLGIEPSDINVQGFLPADSAVIARLMQHQEADDLKDLYEHLPYNTFSFEAINISDYGMFCRDNYSNDSIARRRDLKKYSDSLSANAQSEIVSFMGNYISNFKSAVGDTVYEYGIVSLSDEAKALTFFRSTADSVFINSDSANLFLFWDKKIFSCLNAKFFATGFSYVSVLNEKAVFCNSIKGVGEYRRSVNEKTNFSANERAMQFITHNFNSDVNYLYYGDVFKSKAVLQKALSESMNRELSESPELFEKFDAIGFSLQKLKGSIFYKAHAGFNPKNKMYQNTLWEALADTDLYQMPVPFINHKTNERELVCQDRANSLYLLSNTGKILWKKNVREKMLGEPVQIDFFANGKLQMLFTSENFIHLVDRNGNYVEGFPVKIKSGAAGGISVFDYDNSKNYRLWIPLKNNTVICLNTSCKTVEGFIPVAIKAPLARPITHLMVQQKDYFVLTDTAGNVYVTNRKGELREKINNKLPGGNHEIYWDIGKDISKTYLCFVEISSKTLRKLSLTDKMEVSLLKSDLDAGNYFFDTLQQGGSPLVVLTKENKMQGFDLFAKKVSEIKLKEDCEGRGEALLFGDKKVYAALEKEQGTLQLVDLKTQVTIENEIKLSALPVSYNLIRGQSNYLVGFYRNKIFCIKP